MGEQEGYKPSDEEIQAAEESMTDAQKATARGRLAETKRELQGLENKAGLLAESIKYNGLLLDMWNSMPTPEGQEGYVTPMEEAIADFKESLGDAIQKIEKIKAELEKIKE